MLSWSSDLQCLVCCLLSSVGVNDPVVVTQHGFPQSISPALYLRVGVFMQMKLFLYACFPVLNSNYVLTDLYIFKKLQQRSTKCCTMEVSIHILQLLLLAYPCTKMIVGLNTLFCACLIFHWKGMDS